MNLSENSMQTKPIFYTECTSEIIILKNLKIVIRKPNGRLRIKSLFHKMTYTPLHGKRNLVDSYLTCLSYILILTQMTLMKVTLRDQTLLLSHVSIFMIQAIVPLPETCPTSDPFVVHPSNLKPNGQSQDIETTTDLAQDDSSEQTSEPSTDSKTACELMPQPPSRQSDNPPTLEINDPTTEMIPQDKPSHHRGGKCNLRPNPNPKYSEIYRYSCVQKLIQTFFPAVFSFFIFNLFAHTLLNFFSVFWGQIHKNTTQQQLNNRKKQSL